MKTQHTYPPLLVADSGRNTWVVFCNLPTVGDQELNQKVIAEVEDVELARLIAAAPELLEACENLRHFIKTWNDVSMTHDQLQTLMCVEAKVDQILLPAIKKAIGE